jgi:FAD-linked sulfhydryl oxidase
MQCGEDVCEEAKFTQFVFSDGREIKCPPQKEAIGRAGWGLLHTIAAHYPENPDEKWKEKHFRFFSSFAKVYPCRACGKHFEFMMKEDPPNVENRVEVSKWLCRMHNGVNLMLGKERYSCEIEDLDLRWRKGKPPCTSSINNV